MARLSTGLFARCWDYLLAKPRTLASHFGVKGEGMGVVGGRGVGYS